MSDFPKPASSRTPKMSQTLKGTSQLRKSDGGLRKSTGNMSATVNGYVYMRGSRKFCQRGSNFDNFYLYFFRLERVGVSKNPY